MSRWIAMSRRAILWGLIICASAFGAAPAPSRSRANAMTRRWERLHWSWHRRTQMEQPHLHQNHLDPDQGQEVVW